MIPLQPISIKEVTCTDNRLWGYPGMYGYKGNPSAGEIVFLTNPQAQTIKGIHDAQSEEEKFSFFCYAYLAWLDHNPAWSHELWAPHELAPLLRHFRKRHGAPWHDRAHYLFIDPVLDQLVRYDTAIHRDVRQEEGMSFEPLKEIYNIMARYQFLLLYPDREEVGRRYQELMSKHLL